MNVIQPIVPQRMSLSRSSLKGLLTKKVVRHGCGGRAKEALCTYDLDFELLQGSQETHARLSEIQSLLF